MLNEIQERHSFTKEIIALKNLFQQTTTSFQNMELQDGLDKAEQFEVSQKWTYEGVWCRLAVLNAEYSGQR